MPLSEEERKQFLNTTMIGLGLKAAHAALRLDAELAVMQKELEACKRIERERWEKAAKTFGIGPAAKEVQELNRRAQERRR